MKKRITLFYLLMLAMFGCKKEVVDIVDPADNIEPQTNADGNYNVILITADQEHFMQQYPVGSDYQARQLLRRIGTTFEKHYSCSNVSTSSRSVIYTGTHITNTKMLDNTNYNFQAAMSTEIKTVGKMMMELGYYSAYKGKWHLGKHDASGADQSTALEPYGFKDWGKDGDLQGEYHEGFKHDKSISTDACTWINDKGTELNKAGQSFFLALNLVNPHDIMYFNTGSSSQKGFLEVMGAPSDPLYAKSYPANPIPSTWNQPIDEEHRPKAHAEYFQNWNRMVGVIPSTVSDWTSFKDYYYNCIQDCDNQLNAVLNLLKKKAMLNNTIIIFTADHGEMLGAHGLRGKGGFIYENNIHVPLIIYHPEHKGGQTVRNITSHLDITPTIVDCANSPGKSAQLAPLKGFSLKPMIQNTSISVREGALFVYDMISMIDGDFQNSAEGYKIDIHNRGFVRGIITSNYKFARYFSPVGFNKPTNIDELYRDNDVEMYDMILRGSDETKNMAADKVGNASKIIEYSNKLNNLIEREIGSNDGAEVEAYPGGIWNYAK